MAYTTIKKPSDYFNTKLYSGTGSSQAVSGVGFQPDWIWFKCRQANNHNLFDAIRGSNKIIQSSTTNAEATSTALLTSFDSDGFTVNTDDGVNGSGKTYASWNWLANGTGVANTDGTISSTVSANTTSGFSIVSWSGTGSNGTIGHGLGDTPSLMIIKNRNNVGEWRVWNSTFNADQYLYLNRTDAVATQSILFNSTLPTSSVISAGTSGDINSSGRTYIAYCFAEKTGYSKFGSYTGNGNADGTFVYTGFSPAFVMVKRTDSANSWNIKDNRRNNASTSFNINPRNATLLPNDTAADQDANALDFLSNGFKNKSTGNDVNASGGSYIYMAFAENPLVGTNNIPATAR